MRWLIFNHGIYTKNALKYVQMDRWRDLVCSEICILNYGLYSIDTLRFMHANEWRAYKYFEIYAVGGYFWLGIKNTLRSMHIDKGKVLECF